MNLKEINRLVAEKVMRWKPVYDNGVLISFITENGTSLFFSDDECEWNPTTDIRDAWLVLQKADDFVINKVTEGTLGVRLRLAKIGDIHCMYNRAHAYAKTAPLAICLAALKSVGFVIGGKDN